MALSHSFKVESFWTQIKEQTEKFFSELFVFLQFSEVIPVWKVSKEEKKLKIQVK